jgi:hypothetical protein
MMGSSIEKSPAGGTCLRHVGTRISLCDIRFLTARLPSLTSPVRMFFREPVFAFQVLGPRGNYPKLSIRTSAHAYVAAEDLVWCGIIQPPLGEDWETGEVGAFLPEEVRLLSAVVLSERDPFMNGALGLERGYRRQVEAVALPCALDDPAFEKYARDLAEGLRQDITDCCRCAACGGLPFGTCLRSGAGSLTLTGFLAPARRQPYHVMYSSASAGSRQRGSR